MFFFLIYIDKVFARVRKKIIKRSLDRLLGTSYWPRSLHIFVVFSGPEWIKWKKKKYATYNRYLFKVTTILILNVKSGKQYYDEIDMLKKNLIVWNCDVS